MKIYHVPIEPYETRYTKDWIYQYEEEFRKNNVQFETIYGIPVTQKIINGTVLDACGTHIYKFNQLLTLINKINLNEISDDDVIFFSDLWFPGIESLFYIRNITKKQFKICGILHAGTYDEFDFTYRCGMRGWGKYLEACWLSDVDKIFVATEFHKNLIIKNSIISNNEKIIVTGIPFYCDDLRAKYYNSKKEDIIVFPHRLEIEKHPEIFDELVNWLKSKNINFKAVKTIEATNSREEYFNLIAKSKVMVSFADQETFGYSTVECMALGNIVVVPNKLSYTETVPDQYRYSTKKEAFDMVYNAFINYKEPIYYNLDKWSLSIKNMIKEMFSFN